MVTMGIAFIAGSYFTLSQVLLPMIRALTETTTQMPSEVAFNRLAESGLAGHDTGGGATFVLSGEVKLATSSAWWTADYAQKKQLTVRNLSSVPLATQSATTQQITINTKELYDAGKLQANCEDLRVVFIATQSANMRTELPRSFYPATGATDCSDSTATTVAFPLQEPLWTGGSDSNYEVYYGNSSATDPGYLDQGYSITRADNSTASATLVCPFNGTTTCVGGETPTTQTGAIRYSGSSALRFDGANDWLYGPISNFSTGEEITIEFWGRFDSGGMHITKGFDQHTNFALDYDFWNSGGNTWTFQYMSDDSVSSTYAVTSSNLRDGSWHHISFTYQYGQPATAKFFVDGTSIVGSWSGGGGTKATPMIRNDQLNISSWDGGRPPFFRGQLDEIRISNKIRYTSNFTPQSTPFEPDANTKLLLHFDENGDDPRNTGKAIDSSGNGNHGTITGAKYVSGLVGVDNSSSTTGAIPAGASASHQGIFIEEGTTNLITNPSFEHSTYNTNWGTNYFNYATASATFTPNMAKRNSAGPFAAGVLSQGKPDLAGASDSITASQGTQISNYFNNNFDGNQGSIVFWVTPEWNGNDGLEHVLFKAGGGIWVLKDTSNNLIVYVDTDHNWYSTSTNISSWTAGSTYSIVVRWDLDNAIENNNKIGISVNDVTTYGMTSAVSNSYISTLSANVK